MEKSIEFEEGHDFFSTKRVGEVVILKFSSNVFHDTSDLSKRDVILDFLERISKYEAIKVLIIDSSTEQSGTNEFFKFLLDAGCEKRFLTDRHQDPLYGNRALARFCNIINQFILISASCRKAAALFYYLRC